MVYQRRAGGPPGLASRACAGGGRGAPDAVPSPESLVSVRYCCVRSLRVPRVVHTLSLSSAGAVARGSRVSPCGARSKEASGAPQKAVLLLALACCAAAMR